MIREAGGWACNFLDNNGLVDGGPVIGGSPGIKDELTGLIRSHFRLPWSVD
jgi:hypothetical protein